MSSQLKHVDINVQHSAVDLFKRSYTFNVYILNSVLSFLLGIVVASLKLKKCKPL